MKKKQERQLMDALAVVAFILQAAALGVVLWKKLRSTPHRRTPSARSH